MADRNIAGQVRLIEVLVSLVIIIVAIVLVGQITRPPGTPVIRNEEKLIKIGYNLLNYLAEKGIFEEIIDSGKGWEERMKILVESHLPCGVVFNMTIYGINATKIDLSTLDESKLEQINPDTKLNKYPISNIKDISLAKKIVTIRYAYVCTRTEINGTILVLDLQLGYRG